MKQNWRVTKLEFVSICYLDYYSDRRTIIVPGCYAIRDSRQSGIIAKQRLYQRYYSSIVKTVYPVGGNYHHIPCENGRFGL